MSFDPFENLPDDIKEALKDMIKRLENINPDELMKMMGAFLGEDVVKKIRELIETGNTNFTFPLDPNIAKKFEIAMKEFMKVGSMGADYYQDIKQTPYFEISNIDDINGEIIVEVPGISDLRQVSWKEIDSELEVVAKSDTADYKVMNPLPENINLIDAVANLKNSIFILPFRRL